MVGGHNKITNKVGESSRRQMHLLAGGPSFITHSADYTLADSLTHSLTHSWLTVYCICSGKGQSIMLAIGGATESLYAGPGTMDLVLRRRKGFVRVALQTGASLVPVINFGENDVYSTIRGDPNSGLRSFQM